MRTINDIPVGAVPIAVVDVETTGLHPRGDRVIEIAIIRVDPGVEPRVAVDTLVNPRRPVSATEIHGITDADVHDAPAFEEIAASVAEALSGAVFASFNVYFDAKFVSAELERTVGGAFPPHVCLMYLRPGLGLGKRATLADTCLAHGIDHSNAHLAVDDAQASAELWNVYLKRMRELQIRTFGDLANRLSYKFVESFDEPLLNMARIDARRPRFKSRRFDTTAVETQARQPVPVNPLAEYWDALKAAVADLNVSQQEIDYLSRKRANLRLTDSQVRALHARAFTGLLAQVSDDHEIDDLEVGKIARLAGALRTLGWSPGDPITIPARPAPGLIARIFRA